MHRTEAEQIITAKDGTSAAFVALSDFGEVVGFAEAALRTDYANGCETTPVIFLEGLFVQRHARKQGIAQKLTRAVEAWDRASGAREMASDALITNTDSHRFYTLAGFEETERVVFFKKWL